MAQINTYTDRVTAQGQMNAQADGNAFGANVGAAVANVGSAGMDYAKALHENQVQEEVTNIHVEMAKKRAEWTQQLETMTNETKPGDQSLAPRVMEGLQQQFEQLAPMAKTREGQALMARMSSDMTAVFGSQAIARQAHLNGEFAKEQVLTLNRDLGGTALKDYTQWESLSKQADLAVDDPKGRFSNLSQAQREEMRRSIKDNIMFNAARGFARQNPNAVLGSVDPKLQGEIQNAVSGPAAQPPAPGMPPNLNASVVKPYNQARISDNTKLVNDPSKYDQYFTDAAQLYNLDPRELKMRAVVESGLKPKSDNGQAQGIMQFTPEMAKSLGINPFDPEASIHAAAKLISDYRQKAGGDMSKVDLMYYGGENKKQWGSNTYQYAANMAAQRQSIGLGSSVAPENFQPPAATRVAEAAGNVSQRTGLPFIDNLPPDKQFQILTEAEHYKQAYQSQSERNRVEREHQERKAQDFQMQSYYSRIIQGQPLTELEVVSNDTLKFDQKKHIIDTMRQRTNELAADATTRPHPEKVKELTLAIHAADGDPTKTYSDAPIWEAYKNGELNLHETESLVQRVNGLKDPSGNAFYKQVKTVEDHVWRAIQANPQLQGKEMTSPGTSAAVAYQFSQALDARIADYRKQNKNPAILFDPNSPDYVLKPGFLQSYIPMGGAAPAAPAAQSNAPKVGEVRGGYKFKGGDPRVQTNWEKV